jgi:cholesterol oxidase
MARLSSPIESIKDSYKVVVIGSGYGGAITASRLARAGQPVAVLERGKEWQPGEYPNTAPKALGEFQTHLPDGAVLGPETGLYDLRVHEDINVFMGCGLGGTSLVNANVSIRAEPRVWDDPRWPQAIRDDLQTAVEDGYRRAEEMLQPLPYPESFPELKKLKALQKSANAMQAPFYRLPINVTFSDGPNHVGVDQHSCELCGDCVTGCNYRAKNTLIMNYLPDARNHGAEIFTEVAVKWIERAAGGNSNGRWCVHYEPLGLGRERFNAPEMTVSADIVVLSAGALGSTEILLRSREHGLVLSNRLGERFTGNGDVLGFAYDTDTEINSVGFGPHRPGELEPVGPTITGVIDKRQQPNLDDGMVIEDGSPPGAVGPFLPSAFAQAAGLVGRPESTSAGELISGGERAAESLLEGPYRGAVRHTATYLVMSHDNDAGRMSLAKDHLNISWPGVGSQPVFQRANDALNEATRAMGGGEFVHNPIWSKVLRRSLITVHPLGGCVMAEEARNGVTNHKGQVFASADGAEVYDGLYVSDGAVIPRTLGVNPLLTISAVAERCCAIMARDHGWTIDYQLPRAKRAPLAASAAAAVQASPKVVIEFTETMKGYYSTAVASDNYEDGYAKGEDENSPFEFTLTIIAEDLDGMISGKAHSARMIGTVRAPALSPRPLTVTEGTFNLFIDDPTNIHTRNMRYRMKLTSDEGKSWYFEGFKIVKDGPLTNLWHDTTTLYITLYSAEPDPFKGWTAETVPVSGGRIGKGNAVGQGLLKIPVADFARQLTTMQVRNVTGLAQRAEAEARFGRFFAGTLYDTYGGVFARPAFFNPDAPRRQKRTLRVSAPEVCYFKAADGAELRLTRHQGGVKGPVILSHGLGVSSLIFSIDTIDVNLLEYLFAAGYDVWLLDYRASIELPAALTQFTADDVALKDYPAAVAKVRELTGAKSVQMVAHCYGSTTFFMAMLGGLEGVRSAVASQIATHIVAPTVNRIRTGLHMPEFLDLLGVKDLNAYTDTHENWLERLYDKALALYPVGERCSNPVCHRITFMYAPLYRHQQLNDATHNSMHEMFGIANMKAFEGLALMTRQGHVVAADGGDVYLPHLNRLAIPIAFIHGDHNECFLPRSTEITMNLLAQANGANLYKRTVIPGYGHIDCIFGKNAVLDVYPFILAHLEETATEPRASAAGARQQGGD